MSDSKPGRSYDVAVIGAGVFGAWTAYQLQRSGKRVIIIDAYGAGNSRSSSGGESRIIRMGYGADEIYTRSAQRALRLWIDFSERAFDSRQNSEPLFYRTGVLWLAHADDDYAIKCAETLTRMGISFERLTSAELASRYPQIATNGISWAMLEPEAGALMARRAVQSVVREAINAGAVYVQDSIEPPEENEQL